MAMEAMHQSVLADAAAEKRVQEQRLAKEADGDTRVKIGRRDECD